MIGAVIFDMDGLLVDSEPVWDKARAMRARQAGKSWTTDDHKAVMGVSTAEWVDYMIRRLALTAAPETVEADIVAQMEALYEREIPFCEGAVAAVAQAAATYPVGLASGSPRRLIDAVTGHPDLAGKFKAILSGDQVPKGKPAPDVYLAVAKALGVAPQNCVCLEDSGNGILAGKNAGMRVIAVPDPRFPPSADKIRQADVVLDSLTQFSLATITGLR
jgi:HAD superfamily hydrolase (TIGR01509 family)